MTTFDVAVLGSGFGGSILARVLKRQGLDVALIERGEHPRFALGESSTPLAAISLERLAAHYELPDLAQLATHGRWQRHLPHLRCGLKRGFTFYDHRGGLPDRERGALFVTASPRDALADCHWLRADVDSHLVDRACEEGVAYYPRTTVTRVAPTGSGVELELAGRRGAGQSLTARFVVDATGSAGIVPKQLGVRPGRPLMTRSALVFGHFQGVEALEDEAQRSPYPAARAAVHHLLAEGWMYELRFDDDLVSAGALLTGGTTRRPAWAWQGLLARYPALERSFAGACAVQPIRTQERLQRRWSRAAGDRWAALPHTFGFVDPLFSTGIAWTLRGVERLARVLGETEKATGLERYEAALQAELTQIDTLVAGAYRVLPNFELFATYALAYFAAASWAEARERLHEAPDAIWDGFLGVGDAVLGPLFAEAAAALPPDIEGAGARETAQYSQWMQGALKERDVMGLDRFGPGLSVPVDLEVLVQRHELLGMSRAEVIARLPRLRGEAPLSTVRPD